MTNLAEHLSTFLREYLPCERGASQHTCEAYAYTFQLFVCFSAHHLNTKPSKLTLEDLDVSLVVTFLNQPGYAVYSTGAHILQLTPQGVTCNL